VDTELFDSHGGLRGHKGNLYEGGVRVPLVVRWPGHTDAGIVSDHIGGFQDVMPTLLEIAGIDAPEKLDGISFLPELIAENQPEHDYMYWEYRSGKGWQSARKGNWKALRLGIRDDATAPIQLYNLEKDFAEQNDVAADNPELVEEFSELMKNARFPSTYFPLVIDSIN